MAQNKKGQTPLRYADRAKARNRPFYELLQALPPGSTARSIALGQNSESAQANEPPLNSALGSPMNLRQAAKLIGCSPWTVRQTLIPKGLPHFRSGASGKLIFYTNEIVAWIKRQQQRGGKYR